MNAACGRVRAGVSRLLLHNDTTSLNGPGQSFLFQTRFPRDRTLFAPDRGGTLTGSEFLDRERGEFVTFTLSDQF